MLQHPPPQRLPTLRLQQPNTHARSLRALLDTNNPHLHTVHQLLPRLLHLLLPLLRAHIL